MMNSLTQTQRENSLLRVQKLTIKPGKKTSLTDTFGGQMVVRSAGRAGLFVQRGVFILNKAGKMVGTGQNRSLKRGVRLSRVFVRRGSTVNHLN